MWINPINMLRINIWWGKIKKCYLIIQDLFSFLKIYFSKLRIRNAVTAKNVDYLTLIEENKCLGGSPNN